MELPHGLIEDILKKLPVKSLLRFKSVSTQWKSTIESAYFKKKQLLYSQLQDPDILITNRYEDKDNKHVTRMFTIGSSDLIKLPNFCPVPTPIPRENNKPSLYYTYSVCGSCDGMMCYYNHYTCIYLFNPNTRWFRSVPQAGHQEAALMVMNQIGTWTVDNDGILCSLGFGKDMFTDRYKLVWLYNSFGSNLSNATVCEVFDFNTNTWRYVTASPVRIFDEQTPVHIDGTLYWFTDDNITETKIISFDIHTEKFHITAETPFVKVADKQIIMCTLNNRLCVVQKEWPRQEIWSLNNSDMTWDKIYSLDLQTDYDWFTDRMPPLCTYSPEDVPCAIPVTVLKNKKKSLVLYYLRAKNPNLLIYDPESRSYDLCFVRDYRVHYCESSFSCFPSLMSIV